MSGKGDASPVIEPKHRQANDATTRLVFLSNHAPPTPTAMTTHRLLTQYYNQILTLNECASSLVPDVFVELPDDTPSFVSFLNSCLVTQREAAEAELTFDYYEATQTQSEAGYTCFTECYVGSNHAFRFS